MTQRIAALDRESREIRFTFAHIEYLAGWRASPHPTPYAIPAARAGSLREDAVRLVQNAANKLSKEEYGKTTA